MDTIEVEVQLYGAVQMNFGWSHRKLTIPASMTIGELLQMIRPEGMNQLLLEGGEHSLSSLVMIDSVDVRQREGFDTKLRNGEVVRIVSVISGG